MGITAPRRPALTGTAAVIALCGAVLAGLLVPATSDARFKVGFNDYDYVTRDAQLRKKVFDRTVKENASVVRLNLAWASVITGRPANPSNPADPAYDFAPLDAAVVAATQRGLEPLIMIYRAPAFAEGPGRPASAIVGTWKPNPAALGEFARAVATRYSGSFGGLPNVRNYQIWNEPNLHQYVTPQREGDQITSPDAYRRMLNEAYAAIKGVDTHNRVITAGTAPYGDDSGSERVRPLEFLRRLFCLRADRGGTTCNERVHFDVLAHHPINTSGGPTEGASHPDDVAGSDFKKVRKLLRAAEKAGTVPGGRHPVWATEIWWVTEPPNTLFGIPPKEQAQFIQQAFYVLWKQGADVVLNFQVHDAAFDPANPLGQVQSGVYFRDFKPKPSAQAFAFPFVTDRRTKNKVLAWGIAPKNGKLRIQRKAGKRWTTVDKLRAKSGRVFTTKLRVKGKAKLRAKVRGKKSLVWKQEGAGGGQEGAGRRHDRAARHHKGAGHDSSPGTASPVPPLFRPSTD